METDALIDAVASHVMSTGYFETVNKHEAKSSPGNGMSAAVWFQHIVPLPAQSGLIATAGRALLQVRLSSNMLQQPEDEIDPDLVKATDALLKAYTGDFRLDGLVNSIDLLGRHGVALSAQSGYLKVDAGWFRIIDIDVPLILDDIWEQVA